MHQTNMAILTSLVIFICILSLVQCQESAPDDLASSLVNFNFMNCMDFARHMTSTAEKFGLISSAEAATAAAAARRRRIDKQFVDAVISSQLIDRMFGQTQPDHSHQTRQSAASLLQTFQTLFRQVLNIGDANVAACNARPKLTACENVDNNLTRFLPGWWFDLKVADNANYVASQFVSGSRYHSLVESGMKAYKCFCQC